MDSIAVAAAALNQIPLDWSGNQRRILDAIAAARTNGIQLLCLPELAISGYGCEDMFHAPDTMSRSLSALENILPHTKGMVVLLGLPLFYEHAVLNAVAVVADGEVVGFVPKQNLARDGIHYETRWFRAWPQGTVADYHWQGRAYPLGDWVFDLNGLRFGMEICEDAWVPQRTGANLAARGVELILNPSASHFAFGKHELRKRLVTEASRSYACAYVYANLLGNEAGRAIYDGDCMIANHGRLLSQAERFSYQEWHLTSAQIDLQSIRMQAAKRGPARLRVEENTACIAIDMVLANSAQQPALHAPAAWEDFPEERFKCEEFTRAICLGLFDYMRKSYSQGYVLSLSGGADSAACAVAVKLMQAFATAELGEAGVKQRLSHMADTSPATMLLCAYQASDNSGEVTLKAAQDIAALCGATWLNLNIAPIINAYQALIEEGIGRDLTWQQDDITLQNIQARARAPSIWMLANIRQALLIATSNRSEAAVGYATMDGDTCGGISPLSGIDKHFLLQWLRWLEQEGPTGFGSMPALRAITVQQPTAELRPAEQAQTDEGDLMPYGVLDYIERQAIRDKHSPMQVYELVCKHFPDAGNAQAKVWVIRFYRLWSRNQWKRERYAPSFHYDDANLDPKTWCRFPILSAGFADEIRELELLND